MRCRLQGTFKLTSANWVLDHTLVGLGLKKRPSVSQVGMLKPSETEIHTRSHTQRLSGVLTSGPLLLHHTSLCIPPSHGGGKGAPVHTASNTTAPWGCAIWQHPLPGVRTNAKGTSKVESGRRKVWLREEWQDIPGHENVPTRGNGRREHGADLPRWKEEHTGRYNRMLRFCVPPLGSNPEDVTICKHPTQLKLAEEKKWNGSSSVSRCLPTQRNSFIGFHMQSRTADTYSWLGTNRK